MCHTEPLFKESFLRDISSEDVSASRFLKSKVVKNLSGEYVFLAFNRRNLFRQQSSISALQSVGFFSSIEPSMKDIMLNMTTSKSNFAASHRPPAALLTSDGCHYSDLSQNSAYMAHSNVAIDASTPDVSKAGSLDEMIDLHTVYSVQDKQCRSIFSSTSDNGRIRQSFSFENPSTVCRSAADVKLGPKSKDKHCNNPQMKQKRHSLGEDNMVRMAAFYTNLKSEPTGKKPLQRKSNHSRHNELKRVVKIDLHTRGQNRVSQRRGSASSMLAQQTALFMKKVTSSSTE